MITHTVIFSGANGLHARPAQLFSAAAGKYRAIIRVEAKQREVDGKSILGIMSLGVTVGTPITIKAEGDDAEEAVRELVSLLNNLQYLGIA